jgi:two-component system, NarL family, response regulator DegU
MSTKVYLVEDHPLFRQGLRQTLEAQPLFKLVGEAADGATALKEIRTLHPDIAVVDIELPQVDGLALARALRAVRPPVAVLVLTMHKSEPMVNAALDAGVAGYVLKENAVAEVVNALQAMAAGQVYLCPAVSGFVLRRRQRAEALRQDKPGLDQLTPMERRVLKLVAENRTSREIAAQLFISTRTVETHRANICTKLGLRGSHPLLQFALEHRSEL